MTKQEFGKTHASGADVPRQALMRACAEASVRELEDALNAVSYEGPLEVVRPPEQGLVMLKGRVGGDGEAFNVGEATAIRAVVRVEGGAMGFSYILGRDAEKARLAAIVDALGQTPAYRAILDHALVAVVRGRVEKANTRMREEAAATKVEFLTLVRGED